MSRLGIASNIVTSNRPAGFTTTVAGSSSVVIETAVSGKTVLVRSFEFTSTGDVTVNVRNGSTIISNYRVNASTPVVVSFGDYPMVVDIGSNDLNLNIVDAGASIWYANALYDVVNT